MSAMTKPNLMLPTDLWGEVKVAAYRRGCKPVELVIECLREKFMGPKTPSGDGTSKDGNLKVVKTVRPSLAGSTPAAGPSIGPTTPPRKEPSK